MAELPFKPPGTARGSEMVARETETESEGERELGAGEINVQTQLHIRTNASVRELACL